MITVKSQIAANLEDIFSSLGFAEPSVSQLKEACGVSLRTLYKYYPSKEEMIVAALAHRHQRYIEYLSQNAPSSLGQEAIAHTFTQLEKWMKQFATNGCMSINAITAFPHNNAIQQVVQNHKREVHDFLARKSLRPDLATELFLLHEGISSAWPIFGSQAVISAKKAAFKLLKDSQ